MDQLTYYTVCRSEINNRLLIDEINRANEERTQRRQFVENNRCLHK